MNAASRFLSASQSHDVVAAAAELADDVVMLHPATDEPVRGRDAVADALRAVESACDEVRHTHLLADTSGAPVFGLVFEARIGDAIPRGLDLIEVNAEDRISKFTVAARPISALMALRARMS